MEKLLKLLTGLVCGVMLVVLYRSLNWDFLVGQPTIDAIGYALGVSYPFVVLLYLLKKK